jgi:hypothetical protein
MMTKIKVDGKEHVAIVFESNMPDMEEVQRIKLALCDCLGYLLDGDQITADSDSLFYCNLLLQQMEISPERMNDFFNSYWGKDHGTPKTARVKQCEMYV